MTTAPRGPRRRFFWQKTAFWHWFWRIIAIELIIILSLIYYFILAPQYKLWPFLKKQEVLAPTKTTSVSYFDPGFSMFQKKVDAQKKPVDTTAKPPASNKKIQHWKPEKPSVQKDDADSCVCKHPGS
jgi:hypothetical protein